MSIIKNYEVKRIDDEHVLYVYIKPYFVEFAAEKGDLRKVETLKNEISNIVNKKLKNTSVTACKIMLGSVLLATIPASQLPAYASTASTTEQVTESIVNYTVKSGDTLWKIASTFGVTVDDIMETNNLQFTTIYTDQILKIPSDIYTSYIVEAGDTLYKIANKYSTSVDSIKAMNNLTSDIIYPGQALIVKGAVSSESGDVSSYTVKAGDTLWKISIEFDVSINDIKEINGLTSDNIYIGQELRVVPIDTVETVETEAPTVDYITYKIKSGDNIWSIAIDHGIPMSELLSVNNLTMDSSLSIGQEITIPVHTVPVMATQGEQYGEYLDWWEGARYVFTINDIAKITDFETGRTFTIKRTIGENHADCEPLTSSDASIAKEIWGGYSWQTRAVIVHVHGREIAASMSYMPHGIQYIENNGFDGHFDIHFLNSTRHVDGKIDNYHQNMIKVAAGISSL